MTVGQTTGIEALLGPARLATYLNAADGDLQRAQDLYLWATELSGALHAQLSFVELAVRNAIDPRLAAWNTAQGFGADWTADRGAAPLLYELLRKPLTEARSRAAREAAERRRSHPRYRATVTHDDVVAQLMFGAWSKMLHPFSSRESPRRQERLWDEALHLAFPHADQSQAGRREIGDQLDALRRLRNRVAHHDSLLEVNVRGRLNGSFALLAQIDPSLPALASARSSVRRLVHEDPRRAW